MPRANRYVLPGHVFHLTHRCHNRSFLLRFAVHRAEYCRRLRLAVTQFRISLFDYSATSNHVHLLAMSRSPQDISRFMHTLQGQFAGRYNRVKHRSGAFWQERYRATMVETGEHLLNCLTYIDMNMVRAGVVRHPSEWSWCGYRELTGEKLRFRILDVDSLLPLLGIPDRETLAHVHRSNIDAAIEKGRMEREAMWTEAIAVGSESFVRDVVDRTKKHRRKRMWIGEGTDGAWFVREASPCYQSACRMREWH